MCVDDNYNKNVKQKLITNARFLINCVVLLFAAPEFVCLKDYQLEVKFKQEMYAP